MDAVREYKCVICGCNSGAAGVRESGACHGNTARFRASLHNLWKCPRCLTIHNVDPVDFAEIYINYPLNNRRLDIFARGTLRNLLGRLCRAGLAKEGSILDYGCGNGVFIQYLRGRGYLNVQGYDPFVPDYSKMSEHQFDCVVANDVIEHVSDPRVTIRECTRLVKPGGLLYLGTADSEPIDMSNLESHIMGLHQPFHRVIITQKTLIALAEETGFELVCAYHRSYMDTLIPFANYRFLDEFSKALDHDMDLMLQPAAAKVMLWHPRLWFYAYFGYFFPSAFEPAVLLRRPA